MQANSSNRIMLTLLPANFLFLSGEKRVGPEEAGLSAISVLYHGK